MQPPPSSDSPDTPSGGTSHNEDRREGGIEAGTEDSLRDLPAVDEASRSTQAKGQTEQPKLFVNRELSWLQFNRRVLEEARDPSNPVLERLKFLAIASNNLDEFFEVRVAGTMELVDAGLPSEGFDGMPPTEELANIREQARAFTEEMHTCWSHELIPAMQDAGIDLSAPKDLNEKQKAWTEKHYYEEVLPVLTPLAVDPAHPFPTLLNKSLNLAVLLLDPRTDQPVHRIAVVQVPRVLPRIVRLPKNLQKKRVRYVFMADLVREHLDVLFPGLRVLHSCSFRVTRDSNLDVDEATSKDLLASIERELVKRRRGEPVRLEIDQGAHPEILERFLRAFDLVQDDVHYCDGPVNLGRIMELYSLEDRPDLKDEPFVPRQVANWKSADEMFSAIRAEEILVHHPYDSFAVVEDFIFHAARDPKVLAIKQTMYRAGEDSPLVESLIKAAENRKQVTVVVEIKARFDEETNIRWARRMEQAGVHVVYGIVGLKTHAKMTLLVRREDEGIRRYCHVGTGNYNATTGRIYTDLGLFTAKNKIGQDVADTFNMITGYARVPKMKRLLVAPFTLRSRLTEMIDTEIRHAKAGTPAAIRAKLNSLADPGIIEHLYAASNAGVEIDLLVRGICCLRPGLPGLSENIRVVSVVDRFLEHSRIYYFENGGDPLVYLSSADWMTRNLERRAEVACPITNADDKRRIVDEILAFGLADTVKARDILPDGSYERVQPAPGAPSVRSQDRLLTIAQQATGRPGFEVDEKA